MATVKTNGTKPSKPTEQSSFADLAKFMRSTPTPFSPRFPPPKRVMQASYGFVNGDHDSTSREPAFLHQTQPAGLPAKPVLQSLNDCSISEPLPKPREPSVLSRIQPVESCLSDYQSEQPIPPATTKHLLQDRAYGVTTEASRKKTTPLMPISNGSAGDAAIHASSESIEAGYDKEQMKRLEELITLMQTSDDDAWKANGHELCSPLPHWPLDPPPGLVQDRRNLPTLHASATWWAPEDKDKSMVRMTLPVYNSMIREQDRLKSQLSKTIIALDRLQKEKAMLGVSSTAALKENHTNMVSRTEMDEELTQKDRIIDHLQSSIANKLQTNKEVKTLEAELVNARSALASSNRSTEQQLAKKIASKDLEIAKLHNSLLAMDQKDNLIQKLTDERDKILIQQCHSNEYAQKCQDLIETLAKTETAINDLRMDAQAEKSKNRLLTQQLQEMKDTPNLEKHITKLEEDLQRQTKNASRLRDELYTANKQVVAKQAMVTKLANGPIQSLHGAAHLVEPSANSKLPKTVLGCLECYVMNLQCDNGTRCQNCLDNNHSCKRFRCSLQHALKQECPNQPKCPLKHNREGWLIQDQVRPQW